MCKAGCNQPTDPNSGNGAASPTNQTETQCCEGASLSVSIKNEAGTDAPCRLIPKGRNMKFKAIGAPQGGSYSWTVSGGASIASGGSTQNVEVSGDTASAAVDDVTLSVTYRCGDNTATDDANLSVYEIVKIKAKIRSTPSARTSAFPPDYDEESTESAETFARAKTLIALRGNLEKIKLEVEVTPADTPTGWDVIRASDDHASLGAGVPTLSVDGADTTKANLETNETGSFSVRAFGDCRGTGAFDISQDMKLFPVVLVRATLHQDNSVSHVGHIVPSVSGGQLRVPAGSFNISSPITEAMHLNATIDVVSGGANGRRHID